MCVNILGPTPLQLSRSRYSNCLVCVNILGSTPMRQLSSLLVSLAGAETGTEGGRPVVVITDGDVMDFSPAARLLVPRQIFAELAVKRPAGAMASGRGRQPSARPGLLIL